MMNWMIRRPHLRCPSRRPLGQHLGCPSRRPLQQQLDCPHPPHLRCPSCRPLQQQLDAKESLKTKYGNCSVSFSPLPPRKEAEWRKPLWVPSFPGSGSASPSKKGDVVKELIDSLTGLKQGTKNYHTSMRGGKLKRCRGISETAGCSNGHPYVGVGPEKQTENFRSEVIFVIRNLADAIPALHTEKHIAYHNGKGQAPEHQWKKVRDEYLTGNVQSWMEMIQWWHNADYYQVALYLPFEWLLSPTKGPETAQRLAQVYRKAGFDVAPDEGVRPIRVRDS